MKRHILDAVQCLKAWDYFDTTTTQVHICFCNSIDNLGFSKASALDSFLLKEPT